MLHVEDVFFSNLSGGLMDGICAVTIELGVKRDASVVSLVNAVRNFGKTRYVRITGDFHRNPSEDLELLINTLAEQGVFISTVTKGTEKGPWSAGVTYRVAVIDSTQWLMYGAQEIRYSPSSSGKDGIPLPLLHPAHANAFLYIVPNQLTNAGDFLAFVERYPNFRIFSPPLRTYRKNIEIPEEDE